MNQEKFNEYLQQRYGPQVNWYDRKSIQLKILTHVFQIPIIVLAAITPVFAALEFKKITIISSACVAAGIGILKYCKFEELWHNYRTTCENLKKEKAYYDLKTDVYESADNLEKIFVNRVEAIFLKENISWESTMKEKDKKS